MTLRTRFAPSPTGFLHLGHAYSAIIGHDLARAAQGAFLLRIEDLDPARCRPEYESAIFDDLTWLGLTWDGFVLRQSERGAYYAAALARLADLGVLYPCRCSRGDSQTALAAPQEGVAPPPVYPGTCRHRRMAEAGDGDAIRLNLAKALELAGPLTFEETGPLAPGRHLVDANAMLRADGDVVLQRRDTGLASYHLAVVVDDAAQQITHVVRGADLFASVAVQRVLQALLDLPEVTYHHHDLVRDDTGKRLAKRDDARAIRHYRAHGMSAAEVWRLVGLPDSGPVTGS